MIHAKAKEIRADLWVGRLAVLAGLACFLFLGAASAQTPAAPDKAADNATSDSTIPYDVQLSGVDDADLLALLRESSQLVALADKPPATTIGLKRRAEDDIGRLQTALRSEGYYDAKIDLQIDAEAKPAQVRLTIHPGPRYTLTAYDVSYVGADVPKQSVRPKLSQIGITLGMPARAPTVVAAEQDLVEHLQDLGYPFARVSDRKTFIDRETRKMTVRLSVDAGPAATFGPLIFMGQKDVEEAYLRRIAQWPQGAVFDRRVVRDLQRRLNDTGLFAAVDAEPAAAVSADGSLPVTVSVKERPPRSIGAAASYSTDIGPSLEVFWEHRNLLGQHEQLRVSATGALVEQTGELDFRKPAFLRPDQDLLTNLKGGREDNDAYQRQWVDSLFGLERSFADNWKVSAGVSFAYEIVREKADQNSGDGNYELFGLPLTASRDTTDDPLDPHSGTRLQLSLTPATGTGSKSLLFTTAVAAGSAYYALDKDQRFVLAGRAKVGTIVGEKAADLPASRRFYAGGGGSIRGYQYQLVGPIDSNEDPFGGASVVEVGGELRVRITDEFGIVPFIDGGTVYKDAFPNGNETLRWAGGLGLRYFTGFGPLRLDVALPINGRPGVDEAYQFYISFGQAF